MALCASRAPAVGVMRRWGHSVGRVVCCPMILGHSCKPLSWQCPLWERRMAHGPSMKESAHRGRFALAGLGEGQPVSRRVGLISPSRALPIVCLAAQWWMSDGWCRWLLPVLCIFARCVVVLGVFVLINGSSNRRGYSGQAPPKKPKSLKPKKNIPKSLKNKTP